MQGLSTGIATLTNLRSCIVRPKHIPVVLFFQGNHGEDVKELYYYLDSTPTHSYMKALYKYPQGEYPYSDLERENRIRGFMMPEYEILDTGQ